jgi:hypothetical protein
MPPLFRIAEETNNCRRKFLIGLPGRDSYVVSGKQMCNVAYRIRDDRPARGQVVQQLGRKTGLV